MSLQRDSNEEVSYSAKEGVNHTCVTLKVVGANIETAFDVIVVAKNGSATCGCLLYVHTYIICLNSMGHCMIQCSRVRILCL